MLQERLEELMDQETVNADTAPTEPMTPEVEASAKVQSQIEEEIQRKCRCLVTKEFDEYGRVMKGPQRQRLGSSTPW